MSHNTSAPAKDESAVASVPHTVKGLLSTKGYQTRFKEVLGQRAPQFMASINALAADRNIAACDPRSVIASAFTAATLDLPIEKSLGFAFVVPYKGRAQFQMGYKGYIQLAMRTGQYKRMAAFTVNKEAFSGLDNFREPIINHALVDESAPAVGYMFGFELINGFVKAAYWSRERVEKHAARYSQAYRAQKADSPWFTNFDVMAMKTVISNTLRTFGILSVQMQKALAHDHAVQADIDAEPVYLDGATIEGEVVDRPEVAMPTAKKLEAPAEPLPAAEGDKKPEPNADSAMTRAEAINIIKAAPKGPQKRALAKRDLTPDNYETASDIILAEVAQMLVKGDA